ncbi:methyltransferase [Alteromonas sp. 5E99-2]|uniref:methyltransferase n=1 Tax=Alteromonas sp. 5E99-2 TaxID=2817683 RepID=UPI001A99536D|nr:methyltransferase [Alteromonas sp. 5E99-2]MBO1257004.1 methyltransferase [Alteromonas sp. 5E99-2]
MNTTFSAANRTLELMRYPSKAQHPSLQAWGSEDELVLNYLAEQNKLESQALGRVLILNDEFGALGCGLSDVIDDNSVWQSDSHIGHLALQDNLKRNELNATFSIVNSITPLEGNFDTVLLKLPKSNHYLQHILTQLTHHVTDKSQVIAFGKTKAVTSSILTQFDTVLGKTTTSLAVKKSRLIFCTPALSKLNAASFNHTDRRWSIDKSYTGNSLTLCNLANVFAAKSLDIGARFMLDNLPPFNDENILDLGCGNGVLGLVTLVQSHNSQVTFADESYMAVESAKRAVIENIPDKLEQTHYLVDNCLESATKSIYTHNFDRILCNPPFHQQNTLTDHIAWQMFNDAKACLKKGGKFLVVGNRHLDYHEKLKRVFGGTKIVASNAKFVILEVVKR